MKKIAEPLSLRISDSESPYRAVKLQAVLSKHKASPTDVLRALIDIYIDTDGEVQFPAKLVHVDGGNGHENGRRAVKH